MFKRLIASLVCLTFSFSNLQYVHAQDFSINQLPVPGSMIATTPAYVPLTLKGMVIHPENALKFDFLMDTGHSNLKGNDLSDEALKIMKYFLTALTIPEDDLWVNLSPYEKGRIVQDNFGQTIMGRDLLAEDYVLKQLTASVIYPENSLGKEFWSEIYAKAGQQLGTTQIPVNTFNKVWIVPDQAVIWEHEGKVIIVKNHLKVMLEADYLSASKHQIPGINNSNQISTADAMARDTVRKLVIPVLEKEVNTGKNFAQLRQMFQAMILATWYKKALRESILTKVYANQKKIRGVDGINAGDVESIYQQYLKAFKKGAFNYIKEDFDTTTGQNIPRKYFSGGFSLRNGLVTLATALLVWGATLTNVQAMDVNHALESTGTTIMVKGNITDVGPGVSAAIVKQFEQTPQVQQTQDAAMVTRREQMLQTVNKYSFSFVSVLTTKIISGISRLEANMGARRIPENVLKRFLTTPGVKILVVTDPGSGEIVGYSFGLPQVNVPETSMGLTQYIQGTFYEMSRQVAPNYQGQGIGSAMRMMLIQAVIQEGGLHYAFHQNDTFSKENLTSELQNLCGINGQVVYFKGNLPVSEGIKQQYVVFKLPDYAMLQGSQQNKDSAMYARAKIVYWVLRHKEDQIVAKLNDSLSWYEFGESELKFIDKMVSDTHKKRSIYINVLKSPTPFVRSWAIKGLGQNGDEAVVDLLIPHLGEMDEYMRRITMESIDKLMPNHRKKLAIYEKSLENGYFDVRLWALRGLGKPETEIEFETYVHNLYQSGPHPTDVNAIRKLGDLGDKRAIEPLLRILSGPMDLDKNPILPAENALTKLGVTKEQLVNGYIVGLQPWETDDYIILDRGNRASRIYRIKKLGDLGDKRAIEPLLGMLGDSDQEIRLAAEESLAKLGATKEQMINAYLEAFGKYIEVGGLNDTIELIRKLCTLDDKRLIKPLLGFLRSEFEEIRSEAEKALSKLGATKEQLANGYISVLISGYPEGRTNAAKKLGDLGDKRAMKPLHNMLQVYAHSDLYGPPVILAVREALHKLGYKLEDKAMLQMQKVANRSTDLGGIALDAAMLDLQIKRDGNGVPLPISQQPLDKINIQGFVPQIISIQPVDLPALLGFNFQKEEILAKA